MVNVDVNNVSASIVSLDVWQSKARQHSLSVVEWVVVVPLVPICVLEYHNCREMIVIVDDVAWSRLVSTTSAMTLNAYLR